MTLTDVFRMSCRDATLLTQKKGKGNISIFERVGLWWHRLHCSLCRLFFEQTEMISAEGKKLGNRGEAAVLHPEKKKRIEESLTNEMKRNA